MQTRRSFLSTLGIAGSGIAFLPLAKFIIPENIIAYDGPASLRWMLAESIACLAAQLPENQFRHRDHATPRPLNGSQFGIDFQWTDNFFQRSKREIRECWIEPAMAQMVNEIANRKPTTCYALDLPHGVEDSARLYAPNHGFDLRFVKAWDMGRAEYSMTDDETGEISIIPAQLPRWIARFDMAVA